MIGNEKHHPMLVAFLSKPPTYERLNLTVTYQFTSVSEGRKLISGLSGKLNLLSWRKTFPSIDKFSKSTNDINSENRPQILQVTGLCDRDYFQLSFLFSGNASVTLPTT